MRTAFCLIKLSKNGDYYLGYYDTFKEAKKAKEQRRKDYKKLGYKTEPELIITEEPVNEI